MWNKAEPLDHNSRHMQTLSIHHCCNNALNMTFFFVHNLSNAQILFTFSSFNDFSVELHAIAFAILIDFCID
jgi:hypothetical protein